MTAEEGSGGHESGDDSPEAPPVILAPGHRYNTVCATKFLKKQPGCFPSKHSQDSLLANALAGLELGAL